MSKRTRFEFQDPRMNPEQPRIEERQEPEAAVPAQPTRPAMRLHDTEVSIQPAQARPSAVGDWLVDLKLELADLFGQVARELRVAKLTVALAFVAGAVVGLVVLGWYVWPVQWTNATYNELSPRHQNAVLNMAAELNMLDPGNPQLIRFASLYPDLVDDVCFLVELSNDQMQDVKLRSAAYRYGGADCEHVIGE